MMSERTVRDILADHIDADRKFVEIQNERAKLSDKLFLDITAKMIEYRERAEVLAREQRFMMIILFIMSITMLTLVARLSR